MAAMSAKAMQTRIMTVPMPARLLIVLFIGNLHCFVSNGRATESFTWLGSSVQKRGNCQLLVVPLWDNLKETKSKASPVTLKANSSLVSRQ